VFEAALEKMRRRYQFLVVGYVVMPEHVHLLITEPEAGTVATALQAIKISVARRRTERPLWLPRCYDFLVWSEEKRVEKLRYIHRNPVARGLVERPEDWAWSSFRHYRTGVAGTVEVESWWTRQRREGFAPAQDKDGRCA
jgi:putative transposase